MSRPSNASLPPHPCHVLVLQGGGALGAYQAGAFEAIHTQVCHIDWVAGISIGAINAALIAGNPPEQRVVKLRAFWEQVSLALPVHPDDRSPDPLRAWWADTMAWLGALGGVPGFFRPRPPWAWWPQSPASLYDTSPLRQTLLELVDFDLLNDGPMRFSVGAVDVESGNFTYFDNRRERIGPEHVMASGALPPGFGAVQIGERWYWDGGLVSNTPLTYVIEHLKGEADRPVSVFQIDLFGARGKLPQTLADTQEREKDIRFSSRTRQISNELRERHHLHRRLRELAHLLPQGERDSAAVKALLAGCEDPAINLVHVIHRHRPYESQSKDYEFSHVSILERWRVGLADMSAALALLARQPPLSAGEFRVLDAQPDKPMARATPPRGKSGGKD